jgi:hypothetical protein
MPPTTPQDRRPAKKTTKATARKRNPAQVEVTTVDPNDKYAAKTWGSELGGAEDLTVPSGQLCLVRRPGVQGLMEAGILHDLDMLSGIVDDQHVKRVAGKPPQINTTAVMNDPEQMASVLHLVDRTVCYVVLKPNVQMTPNDPTSRVKGVIYTDMVDIVDKMFIFNYAVGGVRGLEPFREELAEALGSMDAG